jgi:hypothetical protein
MTRIILANRGWGDYRGCAIIPRSQAMNIPKPPPLEIRGMQFLNRTGEHAVRDHAGEIYDCLVNTLQQSNPNCFDNDEEVGEYLGRYLWPPIQPEAIVQDFPHLPNFPPCLSVNGRSVQVLITDAIQLASVLRLRLALKSGFMDTYGGLARMSGERRRIAEEGHPPEEFDRMVANALADINRTVDPWVGFRDVASALCHLPGELIRVVRKR